MRNCRSVPLAFGLPRPIPHSAFRIPHLVAGHRGRHLIQVIAGDFKGRRLKTPPGAKVRPTASRVREAWFSILQRAIRSARVLDLFAGSGALGLEALSRGAATADFVEVKRAPLTALKANIRALKVDDRTTVHRVDALKFIEQLQPGQFDVAFADPPYAGDAAALMVAMFRLTPFARVLSIEHPVDHPIPGDDTRRYGDTAVTFVYAP